MIKFVTIQVPEGSYILPPAKLGPLEPVELSSKEYILGVLRNISDKMPKSIRKTTMNWVVVKNYLMAGTSKGGSTSSIEMCEWLGIDPDAYKL